nr:immunoglobulin light chain junction region [Macaca mulatta]
DYYCSSYVRGSTYIF